MIQNLRTMGLWSAVSIGVGAMIGAGIFALVGLAIEMAGNLAYLSFLIAGVIALFNAYSAAHLSKRYPSRGGRVKFLIEAFGSGITSGGLNLLMWIGYIIVTSLYASAFAHYALSLISVDVSIVWYHILVSSIVIVFLVVNLIGAEFVGKLELFIVSVKVFILLAFSAIGLFFVDPQRLTVVEEVSLAGIITASGLVFVAYEGFGLIANTAQDIKNPQKNLIRAFYISVILVIIVYLLVIISVLGNLDTSVIIESKEYVIAKAAEPFLGEAGFVIMAIAAMFSAASAINATLYAPSYMVCETAKAGQLPKLLRKTFLNRESGVSLFVTAFLVLFFANNFELKNIAELGSIIFLFIYAFVNIAHLKLIKETNAKRSPIIIALLGNIFALSALLYYVYEHSILTLVVFIFVLIISYLFESIYLRIMLSKPGRKQDITKNLKEFSSRAVLQNGTLVHLRAIREDDKQRLINGFHRLTGKSIYFRFFSGKKKLTQQELKYFTEIDFEHHVALVATLINDGEEEIIGVGRYVELEDKGKEKIAEVAFAIDDAHQHLGLGSLLFEHLVTFAQKNGISKFVADVLFENKKMLEIFEHSGFKLDMAIEHGVIHIVFSIAKQEFN